MLKMRVLVPLTQIDFEAPIIQICPSPWNGVLATNDKIRYQESKILTVRYS